MAHRRPNSARVPKSTMSNNLKLIKGIGPIIEQRLHDAGIHTFADLAALSAEQIASIIPGMSARQVAKQGWIPQAYKLVPATPKSRNRQKKTSISTSRQHYENFTFEFLLDGKNKTRRLRVVHVQSGDTDTWAKWDAERLIDFLARHTGSRLPHVMAVAPGSIRSSLPSNQSLFTKPASKTLNGISGIPSTDRFNENSDTLAAPASEGNPQITTSTNAMIGERVQPHETSRQEFRDSPPQVSLLEWKVLLGNTDQTLTKVIPDQPFDVRLTLDLRNTTLPVGSTLESTGTLYAKKATGG